MTDDVLALHRRVALLERRHRRQQLFCGAMAVIAVTPFLLGAQQGPAVTPVVRAGRFEVVQDGKVVASLGTIANGGMLSINDNAGGRVASVQSNATGGFVGVARPDGKALAEMSLNEGGGRMSVANNSVREVVSASVDTGQGGSLRAWDRSDTLTFKAP